MTASFHDCCVGPRCTAAIVTQQGGSLERCVRKFVCKCNVLGCSFEMLTATDLLTVDCLSHVQHTHVSVSAQEAGCPAQFPTRLGTWRECAMHWVSGSCLKQSSTQSLLTGMHAGMHTGRSRPCQCPNEPLQALHTSPTAPSGLDHLRNSACHAWQEPAWRAMPIPSHVSKAY